MAAVAFPPLPEDRLRTIDQLRQRLNQLSTSLGSLKVDLERNEPLPSWPSLQSSAQIVSHNLSQLLLTFESHREFLNAAHAFPLPTFPARSQENLLQQLLRKRLEPSVEDWIKLHGSATRSDKLNESHPNKAEIEKLWSEAGRSSNTIARGMMEAFQDDFTIAEQESGIENVLTGLKRKLWEDDSDEENDNKMEDIEQPKQDEQSEISGLDPGKQPLQIEQILRVMSRVVT
ncbi:hypothetical protein AMS68_003028 [Peltaster fructicola]|uniref:Mediator of RNA polymerase II transcription subunit 8 n=1 Tax=Peltaster fructicola TaxID=286661 RepID=A0A6H0XS82_9PEZI|nr:hypothetical protein AMS68_003028 [Peltaster fructicola]